MNKLLIIIVGSLLTIVLPSLLGAFGIFLYAGHFWSSFLILTSGIYVIGNLWNTFLTTKMTTDIKKIEQQTNDLIREQSLEVSCAYCKVKQMIPIKIDQRNTFECKGCNQTNLVVFQFTTAQITTPLVNSILDMTHPVPQTETRAGNPDVQIVSTPPVQEKKNG